MFQNILGKNGCKPSKLWIYKGNEFYNRSMKSWLQDNNTEIYPRHKEEKSVATERFIRTLNNDIYKQ